MAIEAIVLAVPLPVMVIGINFSPYDNNITKTWYFAATTVFEDG
jgi:hypothetical protein